MIQTVDSFECIDRTRQQLQRQVEQRPNWTEFKSEEKKSYEKKFKKFIAANVGRASTGELLKRSLALPSNVIILQGKKHDDPRWTDLRQQ